MLRRNNVRWIVTGCAGCQLAGLPPGFRQAFANLAVSIGGWKEINPLGHRGSPCRSIGMGYPSRPQQFSNELFMAKNPGD